MDQIKRIAFLCHPYHRGGVTRWMADAATLAAETGHETYFITVAPSRKFVSAGTRETMLQLIAAGNKSIKVISCLAGTEFEFGTEEYRASVYKALIERDLPPGTPIIVSDDSAVWRAAGAVADRYPMVGVLHCDDKYYYDIGKEYRNQMSVCVCVSERVKRVFIAQCPEYDAAKVFAVPCGINLHSFNPHRRNEGITRLVFIGRFNDHQKRAEDLVEICAQLKAGGFGFHLDIAGNDGPSEKEYTARFEAKGVADRVTFHGWQSAAQVQSLLNNSDILILTSNFEGTPLVMMEALAAGCGFTGTRVSGIEDYENHILAPDCVSVYEVGNIADAVGKIRKVAAVPVAIRQAAARQLAEQEFTMAVCMNRYYAAISAGSNEVKQARKLELSATDLLYSRLIAIGRFFKVTIKG